MSLDNSSPTQFANKGAPPKSFPEMPEDRLQPQEEAEIVREFWASWEEQKQQKYVQVNPADQRRYAELYGDQHWDGSQKDWQSTPTINMVWSSINAILGVLTDNRPQIAVIPKEPNDLEISNILRSIFEWIWENRQCGLKLAKAVLNALIFGNGFWKIIWNPSLRKGEGDIDIVNVDPTSIFTNAEATSIEDAEDLYHIEVMSIEKVKRMWGAKVAGIEGGVKDASIVIDRPHLPQMAQSKGGVSVQTTTGSHTWDYAAGARQRQSRDPKKSAMVGERWQLDRETSRWKRTVVVNDTFVETELTDMNTHPIIHIVDNPVGWTMWGTGEVQHVESLQNEINRRRGMVIDALKYYVFPIFIYDPTGSPDIENLDIEPGVSLAVEGGITNAGFMLPNIDLTGLFAVNDRDKQDFNDILGSVDLIQGKGPKGVEAGVAIEALTEAAHVRMRPKVRNIEYGLQRAGQILIKMIQKHYTSERIFRVVGKEFGPSGQPNVLGQEQFFAINKPTPSDTPGEIEFENPIPPDAEFDVRIGAGSTLPVSRTSKFQKAITLFDRKALSKLSLLKAGDWENPEEELQKIQSEMMQEAMAAQGLGGPGGLGGGEVPPQIPDDIEQLDAEPVAPQLPLNGGI